MPNTFLPRGAEAARGTTVLPLTTAQTSSLLSENRTSTRRLVPTLLAIQNFSSQNFPLSSPRGESRCERKHREIRDLADSSRSCFRPPPAATRSTILDRDRGSKSDPVSLSTRHRRDRGKKNVNKVGTRVVQADSTRRFIVERWREGGREEGRGPGVRVGNKSCPFSSGSKKGIAFEH